LLLGLAAESSLASTFSPARIWQRVRALGKDYALAAGVFLLVGLLANTWERSAAFARENELGPFGPFFDALMLYALLVHWLSASTGRAGPRPARGRAARRAPTEKRASAPKAARIHRSRRVSPSRKLYRCGCNRAAGTVAGMSLGARVPLTLAWPEAPLPA
jgi:hypothetical protein